MTAGEKHPTLVPEEPTWGEERHPRVVVSVPGRQYNETLEDFILHRCDEGGYELAGDIVRFPPTDELVITVFGVRKGDTDRVDGQVADAGPLTVMVGEESGTLYRLWATGCLICDNGNPEKGPERALAWVSRS